MAKKKEAKPKLERSYNIPLRKRFRNKAKHKKTPAAVRGVKEFLTKHMKTQEENKAHLCNIETILSMHYTAEGRIIGSCSSNTI